MDIWNQLFDQRVAGYGELERLRYEARRDKRRARRARRRGERHIDALEDEVAVLALLCRGLVRVLEASGHLDTTELEAALTCIDAEDGSIDGKVTRDPAPGARPGRGDAPVPGWRPS